MTRKTIIVSGAVLAVVLAGLGLGVVYIGANSSEEKVKEIFGQECVVRETCGDMLYVDCNSAADGPAYYVRKKNLEVIGEAGGFCMAGQCSGPPEEWQKCTAQNSQPSD